MTFSYNNYTDPLNPNATLYAVYGSDGSGTCSYSMTEGSASYPCYDGYTKELLEYYNAGIPIYYSLTNYSDFGPCYVYTVQVPWDFYPPREETYTLVYQQSSGYLLAYIVNGTEYCCDDQTCVNEGLNCSDGSTAQLTWNNSSTFYSNYQIFNETSFPGGFFGNYCKYMMKLFVRCISFHPNAIVFHRSIFIVANGKCCC